MADKQSLGSLVTGVTEDLSSLIRGEIELAKTELRDSAQVASKGAGLLAAAVGVASMAGSSCCSLSRGYWFSGGCPTGQPSAS